MICGIDGLGFGSYDVEVCEIFVMKVGVVVVLVLVFYGDDVFMGYIWFCFCKWDEVIDEVLVCLLVFLIVV